VFTQRSNLIRFGLPVLAATFVLIIALAMFGREGNASKPNDTTNDTAYQVQPVTIESVDVRIAESFPVQIFVEVHGYVPDPCWEVQDPVVQQDGPRFEIEIMAERPEGAVCAQVIEPYETNIALGSMDPGDYVVSVNGFEQPFEVQ
jgi:hypothetical protein